MPIWSLTQERLDKLKDAIARKKAEHDDLLALSEKDLWCQDLDEFMAEWDNQQALEAEIKTNIRRLGRRVSKKIGAGNARSRKAKDDDEYEPDKKSRGRPKAAAAKVPAKVVAKPVVKAEPKTAQRFAEMFGSKPKPKSKLKQETQDLMELSDNFSDDDFAALGRSKPTSTKPVQLSSEESEMEPPRSVRAAASRARAMFDDDSESNDDQMLGDVGNLVKGIGKPVADSDTPGRFGLHAMNRPDSSQANGSMNGLPKTKAKSAKSFDFDDMDDTNYEMLAKSSPHKAATQDDHIDSFLSDDDPIASTAKKPAPARSNLSSSAAPPGLSLVKKVRGRPAGAKAKEADTRPKAAPKTTTKAAPKAAAKAAPKAPAKTLLKQKTLSPAAKAYAAKKAIKQSLLDSDEDMAEPSSPPPKAVPRGRPGRAAAARRPVVIDDDSSLMDQDDDESDDPFEMDEED